METNMVRFILMMSSCLVLTFAATLDTTHCERVCAGTVTIHDESEVAHCGCDPHSHKHSNHTNHHTTAPPPTTLSPIPVQYEKTTLSMCDYLCSIQMGGAACDCSAPIVPGRKRSKLLKTLSK